MSGKDMSGKYIVYKPVADWSNESSPLEDSNASVGAAQQTAESNYTEQLLRCYLYLRGFCRPICNLVSVYF